MEKRLGLLTLLTATISSLALVNGLDEQYLFWVDDLIAPSNMQSTLWMLKGEDASLGRRVQQYDNEDYCWEAYGTLDGSVCKPSYFINGWNQTDNVSLAPRTDLTTTYDPAGEGDGEHVVGPVVDTTNNAVYYITQTCQQEENSTARRLGSTGVWKVKFLLDNQIVPDGSDANPVECANESYIFAVNRYDVETQKFSLVYAALRENFPAPNKFVAFSWKLAYDPTRERLYWWYYEGSCAEIKTCTAPLYYIDLSGLADGGDMPTPVNPVNMTDGYGHWYWDMTIDSSGNVYLQDWYHIMKFDPTTNNLTTLWTEDYLTSGWHFTGLTWWKDTTLLVSYTSEVTSEIKIFDYSDSASYTEGTEWPTLYSAIYYEFSNLGQTLYNLALDVSHGLLYVATSGGSSAARSILELPLEPEGLTTAGVTACLNAFDMRCFFYGLGERLVVGHISAAETVVGLGKASNFASGTADRFPATGTSQIAVLPKTVGDYPLKNPCLNSSRGSLEHLHTRLNNVTRNRCGKVSTEGFEHRHILYTADAGDKFPNYVLRDYIALRGLRTSSDGGFGYDTQSQYRKYSFFQELDTSGGNLEDFPGLKSEYGYGHAVKGPTVDYIHGYVYWMSCERAMLPLVCAEWALKRVSLEALEKAAAVPDPMDCRFDTCPHSGSAQVMEDRYAVIEPAVEVLYHQSVQLFPGPDDTRTQTTKLAIDPEAEIIYWLTAKPSAGYSAVMFLDVRGWKVGDPPFEPCDVGEVAGHYEYGGWTSLAVACDGTLLSHEIDRLKTLDPSSKDVLNYCIAESEKWHGMAPEDRPGWKGCWSADVVDDCNPVFATGYDPSTDKIYYSCSNSSVVPLRRFNRTEGPGGSTDEVVYSGIYYEFPPMSDKGSSLLAHIAVDDLNKDLYIANYYGSSAQQSVVVLPMPENPNFPGHNAQEHANFWPMDLVKEQDAPIACLYGHESISHASGWDNRACNYQGERLPWRMRNTGMDVVLPNPEGIKRFYITETSSSMLILPAKKSVMEANVYTKIDWASMFNLIPHSVIKTSKTNGWTYKNLAVTGSDLGWQPTHQFCAEICLTFWRKGSDRCVGYTWEMADNECHDLVDRGLLPHMTHDDCSYSNSGLSCLLALVPLTDETGDDYTAWPHPCLTMPTEDKDGNGWITGYTGYAPEGGWPAGVTEGNIYTGYPKRALTFILKDELFNLTEGEAMREELRQMVPNSQWFGTTDSGDYARYFGDLGERIFNYDGVEATNPNWMPNTTATCWVEAWAQEPVSLPDDATTTTVDGGDDDDEASTTTMMGKEGATTTTEMMKGTTMAGTTMAGTTMAGTTAKDEATTTMDMATTTMMDSAVTTTTDSGAAATTTAAATMDSVELSVVVEMSAEEAAEFKSNETLQGQLKESLAATLDGVDPSWITIVVTVSGATSRRLQTATSVTLTYTITFPEDSTVTADSVASTVSGDSMTSTLQSKIQETTGISVTVTSVADPVVTKGDDGSDDSGMDKADASSADTYRAPMYVLATSSLVLGALTV